MVKRSAEAADFLATALRAGGRPRSASASGSQPGAGKRPRLGGASSGRAEAEVAAFPETDALLLPMPAQQPSALPATADLSKATPAPPRSGQSLALEIPGGLPSMSSLLAALAEGDLLSEPTPDGELASLLRCLLEDDFAAPPPATPFYAGEKHKGMTRARREALLDAVAAHNLAAPVDRQLNLVGAVSPNKISLLEGVDRTYAVSGSLARGGYGKFRGGVCIETGDLFGVKELRSPRAPGPKPGKRLKTRVSMDAQTLMELGHLNTLSKLHVYDTVEYNGKIFLFMPWMAGDAAGLMHVALNAQERTVLGRSLVYQILGDLQHCHAAGFVHHDIKPANILWNDDGTFTVSDFGLTRRIADRADWPGGTPGMYAPEILYGQPYEANSDVWSLALTWFDFALPNHFSPVRWHQGDHAGGQVTLQAFFQWRDGIMDAHGVVEPQLAMRSAGPFAAWATEAFGRDYDMTWLLLQHALAPAYQRDGSGLLQQRMQLGGLFGVREQQAAAAATRRVVEAQDPRHNVRGALLAARQGAPR